MLDEELVERLVGVPAVVGGAHLFGLELVKVEVGLDDVAALEVHGDLEVAGPQDLPVVRRRLDHLLLHVEPDLSPLVDEPDAHRLVRHRDAAVLEREREAVGHAGLLEQPLGFGA